jgi:hypothetical protein
MKKIIVSAMLLGLLTVGLQALKLDLGLMYSSRTVKDADIKDVYRNGAVYFPYAAVNVWKGLTFGLGYEGGYDRDGKIGLYQESTNLRISGLEFFAAYRFDFGKLSPYLKLGFGSYGYKQIVSDVTKVDDKKSGVNLAAGLRYYVYKGLFLNAEAKYVPMKVKPLEEEVNLSGMRLGIGAGYTFNL